MDHMPTGASSEQRDLDHSSLKCQPAYMDKLLAVTDFQELSKPPYCLTGGPSREGCLLPWQEPNQANLVLGDEETATHTLSLINNVNAKLETRVTFIHYPVEGQGAQTPKSWVKGEEKKKHLTTYPSQTSSRSPLQMFPTLHPQTPHLQTFLHILSPPNTSSPSRPSHTHLHTPNKHTLLSSRPTELRSLTPRA